MARTRSAPQAPYAPRLPHQETAKKAEATAQLAEILAHELAPSGVVVGITPAGLPLARAVAAGLAMPFWPAQAIPLTPPWNAEPVYGAVAVDGSVHLDDDLLRDLEIGRRDLENAVERARETLASERLHSAPPEFARRHAAVVDAGGAPSIAVAATLAALRNSGAERVIAALAKGSSRHLSRLASAADRTIFAHELRGAD